MQRSRPLTSDPSGSSASEPAPSLDAALDKPDDEQLFYTASLHFLRKRLEEKQCVTKISQGTTRSCCNFSVAAPDKTKVILPSTKLEDKKKTVTPLELLEGTGQSLAMHQVLPFPKTSKESFLSKIKSTFRKYRQSIALNETNNTDESESPKHTISNFKFPRIERPHKCHPVSSLVRISEEMINEKVKVAEGESIRPSSRGDVSHS